MIHFYVILKNLLSPISVVFNFRGKGRTTKLPLYGQTLPEPRLKTPLRDDVGTADQDLVPVTCFHHVAHQECPTQLSRNTIGVRVRHHIPLDSKLVIWRYSGYTNVFVILNTSSYGQDM